MREAADREADRISPETSCRFERMSVDKPVERRVRNIEPEEERRFAEPAGPAKERRVKTEVRFVERRLNQTGPPKSEP